MKCWRAGISRFTPLAVLLFALGVAVPRPGLVFHVHAGGDHVNVHGDDLADGGHDSDDHHAHGHHSHSADRAEAHHHGAVADCDDAAFEAPEPVHLGHWHSQSPFHRVLAPAVSTLVTVLSVVAVAADAPVDIFATPRFPRRARGPPAATVS